MLALIILVAVSGFRHFEGLNWLDSLWLTLITILTVGYGDIIPSTDAGRVFAMIVIPASIASFTYVLGEGISTMLEINLSESRERKRLLSMLKNIRDHIVICGTSAVIDEITHILDEENHPFVIVDPRSELLERFRYDYPTVTGDPTEEHVLEEAGIRKASGLISLMDDDADNMLVVFTARGLAKELNIVSLAAKEETEKKLLKAGANKVINPSRIGGNRVAMSVLRPTTTEYVESMLRNTSRQVKVEEVVLRENTELEGKTLAEARLRDVYGVSVLAIKRGENIMFTPKASHDLQGNDVLVLFGSHSRLDAFRTKFVQVYIKE